jgi:hypothetical protein
VTSGFVADAGTARLRPPRASDSGDRSRPGGSAAREHQGSDPADLTPRPEQTSDHCSCVRDRLGRRPDPPPIAYFDKRVISMESSECSDMGEDLAHRVSECFAETG